MMALTSPLYAESDEALAAALEGAPVEGAPRDA
jgi:hypothetical protein